jgi:Mg-chelatase subunit ChlI
MNPAEGELRPQLSDRIGLQISVQSIMDIEDRVKIMERREAFERDPHAFREEFKEYQNQILENIIEARTLLPPVQVSPEMIKVIAQLCVDMGVDGHRADIAILKTSKTLAAYYKHQGVESIDVEEAAALVLGERFHKKSLDEEKIKKQIKNAVNEVSRDETGDDKKKSQTT